MNANDLDLLFFTNTRSGSVAVSIDGGDTIFASNGCRTHTNENLWDESDDNLSDGLTTEQIDAILSLINLRETTEAASPARRREEHRAAKAARAAEKAAMKAEHIRRLAADPAYRADHEARVAAEHARAMKAWRLIAEALIGLDRSFR